MFAPSLVRNENSVKGIEFAKKIVKKLNLHHLDSVGKELELMVPKPKSFNKSVYMKFLEIFKNFLEFSGILSRFSKFPRIFKNFLEVFSRNF